MVNVRSKARPDCKEMLENKHIWSLSEIEFDLQNELKLIIENSDQTEESYLISVIQHRYNFDRYGKIISNFRMWFNEKRDLIRNSFFNNGLLHLIPSLKSKNYEKTKSLSAVMIEAYKCPLIVKIFIFIFVFTSLFDSIYFGGIYFAYIFVCLIAFPLIVSVVFFDFLVICLLILKNYTVSTLLFEGRFVCIFIVSILIFCSLLVGQLIFVTMILRSFLTSAFIIAVILLLAITFDSLFFNSGILIALIRSFGEYVLGFSILSIFIFFILISVVNVFDNSITNHRFVFELIADLSKFVLYFGIFYLLNFWYFVFIEIIYNNPILNCRYFSDSIYDEYFMISIRMAIVIFLFITGVSAIILDFFFTYAFLIAVIIIWAIYSEALIYHCNFNQAFVNGFDRYILQFCTFSFLNSSILFSYAFIFDNPILDRRFVFAFNPSFSLFEYSFLIIFIFISWFLKLAEHFLHNLIQNRRIIFGLSEFVISSCLYSATVFFIPNSIIPIFDKTILNQRLINILILGIDKFLLLFCTIYICIYIFVILNAHFLNRFRSLNHKFFGNLYASFIKFLLLFYLISLVIPKLAILNPKFFYVFNTVSFISLLLALKFYYKNFNFSQLIKPASLFGVLIIGLLIFGTQNFVAFISHYNFLLFYCFFIMAIYP